MNQSKKENQSPELSDMGLDWIDDTPQNTDKERQELIEELALSVASDELELSGQLLIDANAIFSSKETYLNQAGRLADVYGLQGKKREEFITEAGKVLEEKGNS